MYSIKPYVTKLFSNLRKVGVWFFLVLLFHTPYMKFCVRGLKTVIKARFTEPFPSFPRNTHKLYIIRHCIYIVFNIQINHINPLTFTLYNYPLFFLLSFFCWSLCCLSFFDLQLLITHLVSSKLS